jgi:hypothetical protein
MGNQASLPPPLDFLKIKILENKEIYQIGIIKMKGI